MVANHARGQLKRENNNPGFHSRLRIWSHDTGSAIQSLNIYSLFYMGVGTGYTLLQGHTVQYDVAPCFLSSTVITVLRLYYDPLVSPLHATLKMIGSVKNLFMTLGPSLWRGCIDTLVSLTSRFTLIRHGSGARLSPRAMAPFSIKMNFDLINPRWRPNIE